MAEKLVAPTEWNTTVVAEEAMCPKGKHVPVRSRVLIARCATVRLRGDCPFLMLLARQEKVQTMQSLITEPLGLYGWEKAGPVLLAALLTEEPLLLVGARRLRPGPTCVG